MASLVPSTSIFSQTAALVAPPMVLPVSEWRAHVENTIANLIDLLDRLDGDADFEPNGDEWDFNDAEDDFWTTPVAQAGPGCPLSDPGGGNVEDEPQGRPYEDGGWFYEKGADLQAYREHVQRIRSTRCQPIYKWRYWNAPGGPFRDPRPHAWQLFKPDFAPSARSLLRRKRGVPKSPRA